jgi:hypothetical protein
VWDSVSWKICQQRDNPACADSEHAAAGDPADPGLHVLPPARSGEAVAARTEPARPRVAILREQGVNSHVEMAYAFTEAGFDAVDVHMTDLQAGRHDLKSFRGVVACGGFSYGDTLGGPASAGRVYASEPIPTRCCAAFRISPRDFLRIMPAATPSGLGHVCKTDGPDDVSHEGWADIHLQGGADAWPRLHTSVIKAVRRRSAC